MSEPRKPIVLARVSTYTLRRAVKRLPLDRYPARLVAIDEELERRRLLDRRAA